jgi:hypothetical protein
MAYQFHPDPDGAAKFWYDGLTKAGESFGKGIEGFAKGLEKKQDEDKNRAREFKALQEYADVTGIAGKDKTTTMDLDGLQGLVKGTVARQTLQESLARHAQEMQYRDLQMQGMAGALDQEDKRGGFWDALQQTQTPPMAMSPEAQAQFVPRVTTGNIFGAMRSSGYSPKPEELDGFIKALQSAGSGGIGDKPMSHELPGGYLGFTLPGTKQMDIRADLTKAPANAVTQYDEDGNEIGLSIPNGKGGHTFKANKKVSGELMPVLDPVSKKPVRGFGMDSTGKVHDFRSTIDKAVGAEEPAGPPEIKDQSERDKLPKGTVYLYKGVRYTKQ